MLDNASQLLYVGVFCCFLCALIWDVYRKFLADSCNVPGPRHFPFIGVAYLFTGNIAENTKTVLRISEQYPDIAKCWLGNKLFYLVSKPEYLEILLNHPKCVAKSKMYDFFSEIVGDTGLLNSPTTIWKRHRKILSPCFNQKILNSYNQKIIENCENLTKMLCLKKTEKTEDLDVCRHITNCSLDIVCETLFGVKIGALENHKNYCHVFDKIFEIAYLRISKVWYHSKLIFSLSRDYPEYKKVIGEVEELTEKVLTLKKAAIFKEAQCQDTEEKSKKSVLNRILVDDFTDQEVEDEIKTFLLAGTDTNATAVLFILTLLGMHPEIQEKVHSEISDLIIPGKNLELEDLGNLKYTECVIKEALRILPPVPIIGRKTLETIQVATENGDVIVIPRDSQVVFNFLRTHRNPEYWKDPMKFDPDRFLPETGNKVKPYSWLPFAGGPRNCIGLKFGFMVMKCMVATIIRDFHVETPFKKVEDVALVAHIVLRPEGGFKLSLKPRHVQK